MGSHTGDFFERFIKKAVICIANLGADLRDGERGIGEKLAGPFNADMLQIFHDAGAGSLFEKAGEVAFAQKEVVRQLFDCDFFGIIFPEILDAVRDQLMAVFDDGALRRGMILPIKAVNLEKKLTEGKTEKLHIIDAFGSKFQVHFFIELFDLGPHRAAQFEIRTVDDLVGVERFIQHNIGQLHKDGEMNIDAADKFREKAEVVDNQMLRIAFVRGIKTVGCPGVDDIELSLGYGIGDVVVNMIPFSVIDIDDLDKIMGMYF